MRIFDLVGGIKPFDKTFTPTQHSWKQRYVCASKHPLKLHHYANCKNYQVIDINKKDNLQ